MPNFRVTNERGFWDGVKLHKRGTIISLEPADYKKHLSVEFEGMDDAARKALAKARTEHGLPPDVLPEPDRNGYDPHKREDLIARAKEGVKVVEAAPEPETRTVRPSVQ